MLQRYIVLKSVGLLGKIKDALLAVRPTVEIENIFFVDNPDKVPTAFHSKDELVLICEENYHRSALHGRELIKMIAHDGTHEYLLFEDEEMCGLAEQEIVEAVVEIIKQSFNLDFFEMMRNLKQENRIVTKKTG